MEITRTSVLTGIQRTRELPVSEGQLAALVIYGAAHAHTIFVGLHPFDIDFIVMGTMPEDWKVQSRVA